MGGPGAGGLSAVPPGVGVLSVARSPSLTCCVSPSRSGLAQSRAGDGDSQDTMG